MAHRKGDCKSYQAGPTGNWFWLAKYLIDKDGVIRYRHFGEGAYDETEEKIRELLAETGADVTEIPPGSLIERAHLDQATGGDASTGLTRELYFGYRRNFGAIQSESTPPYIVQSRYYESVETPIPFEDPGEHQNHFLYLHGVWTNGTESITHGRQTEGIQDYVSIKFFASSVNVLMRAEDGAPLEVLVTLDGQPLAASDAGADVQWTDADAGASVIAVDEARLYRIVRSPEFNGHELRLSSSSDQISLFAFTFGAFDEQTGS